MLIKQLDKNLLHLAWSLWTELGVAGVQQNHSDFLIWIEELILFTSALSDLDPRLRDESLDWCSKFYHFISISRLKALMKDFEEIIREPFSKYASNLNHISKADLPTFTSIAPLKIHLSNKSVLRPHASPALLNIRARSLFGTGARADLVTFFLVHPHVDFSIAEATETGYSKRNLAEIFDDLYLGNLFDRFLQGNQYQYRLKKNSPLFQVLKPIPKHVLSWRIIFKILLSLRACIHRTENSAESTKAIELQNWIKQQERLFHELELHPPHFQKNYPLYLKTFSQWILEWTDHLADGEMKK